TPLQRLVEVLQEFPPLNGRETGPVDLVRMRAPKLAITDTGFRPAVALPFPGQPLGGPSAQQVHYRRGNLGIPSQVAVSGMRKVCVRPLQGCAVGGYGSITVPCDRVHEAILPRDAAVTVSCPTPAIATKRSSAGPSPSRKRRARSKSGERNAGPESGHALGSRR